MTGYTLNEFTTITLDDLIRKSASVSVDFQGTPLTVWFNPGMLTLEFYEHVRTLQEAGDEQATVLQLFRMMVEQWSIADADGAMVPITDEVLRKLPMALLNEVITTIQESVSVPKERSIST